MEFMYVLVSIVPWILVAGVFAAVLYLQRDREPDRLVRDEVEELKEQVSLLRDFIGDAMDRIRALEERETPPPLSEGDGESGEAGS